MRLALVGVMALLGSAELAGCTGDVGDGAVEPDSGAGGHYGQASAGSPMAGSPMAGMASSGGSDRPSTGGGQLTGGEDTPCAPRSVEPVLVRRLSHVEYARTVRDLLPGIELPDMQFAPDLAVHGFENNATSLNPSAILVEQYNNAAVQLAERAAADLTSLVPCAPQGTDLACARQFVETFGVRAFRRPLTGAEVDRYVAFFESQMNAISWNGALQLTLQAFLQSPQFTYRLEFGETGPGTSAGAAVPLTAYELASRLSYFLWQSMPDETLLDAAASGALSTTAQIEAQARRMLQAPRGREAAIDFHRQWLELDRVLDQNKDANLFPDWNDRLREALYDESSQLVGHLWTEGTGTVAELLTSTTGFVNGPVAALYDVPGVGGELFEQVSLPPSERAGILSRGAFLASHAHSTNGSPPLRGVAVLDRLLCAPPPAPPADADTSAPTNDVDMPRTNRELFDERTSVEPCNQCHRTINGIGNAFESFDATGRFRTQDNGFPVDASGALLGTDVDGPLDGATELGQRLAASSNVLRCVVRNWYRYAHGREDVGADRCQLDQLNDVMTDSGGDMRELLIAIAASYEFGHRLAH